MQLYDLTPAEASSSLWHQNTTKGKKAGETSGKRAKMRNSPLHPTIHISCAFEHRICLQSIAFFAPPAQVHQTTQALDLIRLDLFLHRFRQTPVRGLVTNTT